VANKAPENGAHVANLGGTILSYFGLGERVNKKHISL